MLLRHATSRGWALYQSPHEIPHGHETDAPRLRLSDLTNIDGKQIPFNPRQRTATGPRDETARNTGPPSATAVFDFIFRRVSKPEYRCFIARSAVNDPPQQSPSLIYRNGRFSSLSPLVSSGPTRRFFPRRALVACYRVGTLR